MSWINMRGYHLELMGVWGTVLISTLSNSSHSLEWALCDNILGGCHFPQVFYLSMVTH